MFGLLVLLYCQLEYRHQHPSDLPDGLVKSVSKPPTTTDHSKDSSEQTEIEHRLNQVGPILATLVISVYVMLCLA